MPQSIKLIRRVDCENVGLIGKLCMATETDDFTVHNLFYGRNGSGKTVFSSALWLTSSQVDPEIKLSLERRIRKDNQNNISIKLTSDGRSNIQASSVPIFVFNTEFISQHVYDGSDTKLHEFDQSVVTVGNLLNPKIKQLEDEVSKLRLLKDIYSKKSSSLEDLGKEIKDQLSKELNAKIPGERMPQISIPDSLRSKIPTETLDEIRNRLDEHYEKYERTKNQELISIDLGSISNQFTQINENIFAFLRSILTTRVSSKSVDIERKIREWREIELKHYSPQDWLEDGKGLLMNSREDKKCPLCNSLLTEIDALIDEYGNFFNSEADDLIGRLSNLESSLIRTLSELTSYYGNEITLKALESKYLGTITSNSSRNDSSVDFDTLRRILEVTRDLVVKKKQDINLQISEEKIEELSYITNAVKDLNRGLEALEKRRSNLSQTLDSLKFDKLAFKETLKALFLARFDKNAEVNTFYITNDLEQPDDVTGGLSLFTYLDNEIQSTSSEIDSRVIERIKLLATLKQESKLINEYLKRLSVHSFEVKFGGAEEDIEITYNAGVVKQGADNCLSEGEKSALAFAYFLSKIRHEVVDNQGAQIVLENCVVIIDDPVSSLDEDRLFSTALVIRDEFSNCKQLFVLSHNLVFLRLFGNIMKGTSQTRKDYVIDNSVILNRPTSLRNFHTSYFYKYQKIIDFSNDPSLYDSSKDFLPNYIRTVLETFLSFKFFRLHGEDNFQSPGLPQLIRVVGANLGLLPNTSVNSVSKSSILNDLEHINKKVDPESHGTPQDLTDFEYIPKNELQQMSKKVLEIIEYLDGIHSREVSGRR